MNQRSWLPVAAASVLLMSGMARGQSPYPAGVARDNAQFREQNVVPVAPPTMRYARLTGQSNPAAAYFARGRYGQKSPATSAPAAPASQTVNTAPLAKPFAYYSTGPNVSPYLLLDALESQAGLPNYHAWVRPQLEQQQRQQQHVRESLRVQQQLRVAATRDGLPPAPGGGIPTVGHSRQFFNSGGYYPGLAH